MNSILPPDLARILGSTPGLERALLAGGCVRDWLLGLPVRDFDIEVYGLTLEELTARLERWGKVDQVGRSFGVLKLSTGAGAVYDFTLPRRDSRVGSGHRGFAIAFDPAIEPREAAARRDFTINAMLFDPRRDELLDFFGGQRDLEARRLSHTSPAFAEDPLRVLRGMQFAGRFDLSADDATLALCRAMLPEYGTLAVERVREEWLKWASHSTRPSAGLRFLQGSGWIETVPEIAALIGTPQDPEWHPEGDVFTHTALCVDALAGMAAWRTLEPDTHAVLMFAALLHDVGKPATTHEEVRAERMHIVSPGHDALGAGIAERVLARLGMTRALIERVLPLIAEHLAHLQTRTPRAVRRLARRMEPESIRNLALLIRADHAARPPRSAAEPEGLTALLETAAALDVESEAPRPLLQGRHLIEAGMAPGPAFRALLDEAFDAQLDGAFSDVDGARAWLAGRRGGR